MCCTIISSFWSFHYKMWKCSSTINTFFKTLRDALRSHTESWAGGPLPGKSSGSPIQATGLTDWQSHRRANRQTAGTGALLRGRQAFDQHRPESTTRPSSNQMPGFVTCDSPLLQNISTNKSAAATWHANIHRQEPSKSHSVKVPVYSESKQLITRRVHCKIHLVWSALIMLRDCQGVAIYATL